MGNDVVYYLLYNVIKQLQQSWIIAKSEERVELKGFPWRELQTLLAKPRKTKTKTTRWGAFFWDCYQFGPIGWYYYIQSTVYSKDLSLTWHSIQSNSNQTHVYSLSQPSCCTCRMSNLIQCLALTSSYNIFTSFVSRPEREQSLKEPQRTYRAENFWHAVIYSDITIVGNDYVRKRYIWIYWYMMMIKINEWMN